MKMEKIVKRYFLNTSIEEWNYEDFDKYMRLLGYKNNDNIFEIYNMILKEFADHDPNDNDNEQTNCKNCKSRKLIELSKRYEEENRKVIIFLFEDFEYFGIFLESLYLKISKIILMTFILIFIQFTAIFTH